MLAPNALLLPPGAPSAGRATRRRTTGARLRDAGLGEVTRTLTGWPGAGTAVAHTSRRLTLAPRRGGSGRRPWGGGRLPTMQIAEGPAAGTGHSARGGRGGGGEAG